MLTEASTNQIISNVKHIMLEEKYLLKHKAFCKIKKL